MIWERLAKLAIGIGRKGTHLQSGRMGNADEKAGTSPRGFGRLRGASASDFTCPGKLFQPG
jgi:hypothetical protein